MTPIRMSRVFFLCFLSLCGLSICFADSQSPFHYHLKVNSTLRTGRISPLIIEYANRIEGPMDHVDDPDDPYLFMSLQTHKLHYDGWFPASSLDNPAICLNDTLTVLGSGFSHEFLKKGFAVMNQIPHTVSIFVRNSSTGPGNCGGDGRFDMRWRSCNVDITPSSSFCQYYSPSLGVIAFNTTAGLVVLDGLPANGPDAYGASLTSLELSSIGSFQFRMSEDSSGPNIGAIAGGVVGGTVGLVLLAGTIYYVKKRRSASTAKASVPNSDSETAYTQA